MLVLGDAAYIYATHTYIREHDKMTEWGYVYTSKLYVPTNAV